MIRIGKAALGTMQLGYNRPSDYRGETAEKVRGETDGSCVPYETLLR